MLYFFILFLLISATATYSVVRRPVGLGYKKATLAEILYAYGTTFITGFWFATVSLNVWDSKIIVKSDDGKWYQLQEDKTKFFVETRDLDSIRQKAIDKLTEEERSLLGVDADQP